MASGARIQIVDYRLGNLFSIQQACERVGLDAFVSANPDALASVDGIILPGVGAFGDAMNNLKELRLLDPLCKAAGNGKPLLGICLGMQLLFKKSEEFGDHEGLGLLSGYVEKIPEQTAGDRKLRVPNVGWNRIRFANRSDVAAVLDGVEDGAWMYFVHSYCARPGNLGDQLTLTDYGTIRYCSGVLRGSILGVQFHPEKSGRIGLRMYENWARGL